VASQVEICNRALTKIGGARITSLADACKGARVMSALWDTVRRAELRKRFWSFALRRASLASLGTAPGWGFALAYQLPSDFLRLVQVSDVYIVPGLTDYREGDDSAYAIEGLKLCTDFPAPLKMRYVADVTDPGAFDALFVEVLSSKLAYEACYDITQSNQGREAAAQDYKMAVVEAARANAIEKPPQGFPDDSWMLGRL
jgi:hypothetical protein